jgi:hypothetical protein
MTPQRSDQLKVAVAVLAFLAAVFGFVRFYSKSRPAEGKAFFFDLGAKRLFVAPHSSVPPIRGVVGEEEDGVRAIVLSPTGDCSEKSRVIAYLETYTPELKRQVEARVHGASAGAAPENALAIRRGEAHGLILVKRPDETDWHPMNSPGGQAILQTINAPGPDGKAPVVCMPED